MHKTAQARDIANYDRFENLWSTVEILGIKVSFDTKYQKVILYRVLNNDSYNGILIIEV